MQDRFSAVVVRAARTRVSRAVPMSAESRVRLMHRRQISDLVLLVVIVLARVRIIRVRVAAETDAPSAAVALRRAPGQH